MGEKIINLRILGAEFFKDIFLLLVELDKKYPNDGILKKYEKILDEHDSKL